MNRRRVLTRAQERAARRAIRAGATRAEAAQVAGTTERKIYHALHLELADLPPGKHGPRPGVVYPPRPVFVDLPVDEIYRRAALIRETWTEDEKRERYNPRFCPLDDA